MRSAGFRNMLIALVAIAAGVLFLQYAFLSFAVKQDNEEWEERVASALRQSAGGLSHGNPYRDLGHQHYILRADRKLSAAGVDSVLAAGFAAHNAPSSYGYFLYDPQKKQGNYYGARPPLDSPHRYREQFPKEARHNYVILYFPNHPAYARGMMGLWQGSALLMVLLVTGLGYALYAAFREKRYGEIKQDFIKNISHEIKTPLSTIHILSDMIRKPDVRADAPRMLKYASMIEDHTLRLARRLEHILSITNTGRDGIEMHKRNFVWQELLRETREQFTDALALTGGSLTLHMPDAPVYFYGDPEHIVNAVGNLIDNSIKYCHVSPDVHVYLRVEKKEVRIDVEDNGIGIAQAQRHVLFEDFYRVPTGNRHDVKGLGLGLSYVRLVARQHHCRVSFVSQLGKGSIFTLTCPKK